ncbi:MAG: peptidoglycan DD-metalloendopeptidase family protein [Sphingomonas sp.]|jgi:septal ring factor EnvC (AmiA/AmiB activator)
MAAARHYLALAATGVIAAATLAAATLAQSTAPGHIPASAIAAEQQRLRAARAQSAAAQARANELERAAAAERDEALKAQQHEAAIAAHVQTAEADISAAQSRIMILRRLLDVQRATLAQQQGPIVRLMAALQSLARRPGVLSIVQPGSINDLVHVRAALGGALPVVRARTAELRTSLARSRVLQNNAALAVASLAAGRRRLEAERLALTRLEAEHRLKSRALGRDALFESDRAIALGEQARDLVDLMDQLSDAAQTRAALESLPGPLPRPPKPGEAPSPIDRANWLSATAPYRLPVAGRIVTGLGEVSQAGVRSRGLTFEVAPGAQVVAPAPGHVLFARSFRGYGVVVIIDHGAGWTTLVAGLGSAAVQVGSIVVQGGPLGAAEKGNAPKITVELRRRDRAIDMTRLIG